MALITDKTVVLLLVLGFVQVLNSQARHKEFVFGPREHLDSGQESSDEYFPKEEEEENFAFNENSKFDGDYGSWPLHPIRRSFQDSEELLEEGGDIDELDEFNYDEFDMYDEEDGDDNFSTSEESSLVISQVPLKRVRRRIIPVGKAIDRGRPDSGGAYGRNRSPWEQPTRNRDPVVRRSGPTGSAALFSLYPELAPPEWKSNKGDKSIPKKKKSSHQERDTESIKERPSKQKKMDEVSQSDEGTPSVSEKPQRKKTPKRKSKISKKMKEEIAKFAEVHGVERAVTHFKSRVSAPLRQESVEKYLRRYKNRMERKASRS